MAEGAAVAAVASTFVQISAAKKEAKAQAEAANQNAASKRAKALELLERHEINSQALVVEGAQVKGRQRVQFAGRGFETSVGAPLSIIEETDAIVISQLMLDQKEVEAKVASLRAGADIDEQLAGDVREIGRLRRLGAAFAGISGVARSRVFG